jgi:hypothetical protein
MSTDQMPDETASEYAAPPFLYEIRAKGRLSGEQWMSWFDGLTVSTSGGESTLRGRALDHAALYGVLARLRDLAVPLVSVKVLDAEAQKKLSRQVRRYDLLINLLLVAVYLALVGGLVSITVFVAPVSNPALVLTLLFALLGGIAHAFWLWSGHVAWRWLTYVTWPAAAITFLVYIPASGILPEALSIGIMFLLMAGGLLYLVYYLRRRAEDIQSRLASSETGRGSLESFDADTAAEAAEPDADPEREGGDSCDPRLSLR